MMQALPLGHPELFAHAFGGARQGIGNANVREPAVIAARHWDASGQSPSERQSMGTGSRGEPIVCTAEDAYRCFMRTEMDYMVIDNCLFGKIDQPEWENKDNWKEEFVLD
jgi:hypothetical protein